MKVVCHIRPPDRIHLQASSVSTLLLCPSSFAANYLLQPLEVAAKQTTFGLNKLRSLSTCTDNFLSHQLHFVFAAT